MRAGQVACCGLGWVDLCFLVSTCVHLICSLVFVNESGFLQGHTYNVQRRSQMRQQPGKKGFEAQITLSGVLLCGTDCAYFKHLNHQSMLKITSLVPRLI